jgi:hypothetical protein
MAGCASAARRERARPTADLVVHVILAAAAVFGWMVLFLVIVNLAATPRLSRARPPAGPAPRVSVIVPARNEERAITAAVGSQLAQDYPDFEVLVVNDRSTDRTGTILEALARENPRLRIISGADPGPGWLGKPHAGIHRRGAAPADRVLVRREHRAPGRPPLRAPGSAGLASRPRPGGLGHGASDPGARLSSLLLSAIRSGRPSLTL